MLGFAEDYILCRFLFRIPLTPQLRQPFLRRSHGNQLKNDVSLHLRIHRHEPDLHRGTRYELSEGVS